MAFFKVAFLLLALLEPVTVFGYPYSGYPYGQGSQGGVQSHPGSNPAYNPYGQGGHWGTQGGQPGVYDPYGQGGHGGTQGGQPGVYDPYGQGGHGGTQGGQPGVYDPYAHGGHGGTPGGHGGGHSWDYNRNGGGTNFNSIPSCNGYRQSPINIQPGCTTPDGSLRPFSLAGYDAHGQHWHLKNNGHTVQMSNLGSQVILRGGSLNGDYILDQFHFHWGSRNDVGSEHLIDGKASPLEMHMVHHLAYDPNQLSVLSFLFEIHATENPNFSAILRYFDSIIVPGKDVEVLYFSVSNLIPRDFAGWGYFRYNGSLTTPPCNETVTWTVFEHKIGISYKQLEQFRKLMNGYGYNAKKIWDNFRMTQGINYRWVLHKLPSVRSYYYNQNPDCVGSHYGGSHSSSGFNGGSYGGHGGSYGGHGGSYGGHVGSYGGHGGGHATTASHGGGHGGGHGGATTASD